MFSKNLEEKNQRKEKFTALEDSYIYIQTGHSWQCKKKNSVQHDDQHTDEQQSLKSTLLNICQARR